MVTGSAYSYSSLGGRGEGCIEFKSYRLVRHPLKKSPIKLEQGAPSFAWLTFVAGNVFEVWTVLGGVRCSADTGSLLSRG